MRILMLETCRAAASGLRLKLFERGRTYELVPMLACQMIARGHAELTEGTHVPQHSDYRLSLAG